MKLSEKLNFIFNSDFTLKYTSLNHLKFYFLFLSIGIIFVYLNRFLGIDGSVIAYTHDNFDSNIAVYKLLSDTNSFFISNETIILNIMNGIPRATMPSEYNIIAMLYYLFSPSEAYLINEFLIRMVAFSGMFLLLKRHFYSDFKDSKYSTYIVTIGTALIFALLPYWSNGGVSIAGQPFVIYAFLNIKNRDFSFGNWLILCIYIIYSSLILVGMFTLFMLVVITIYDLIKNKTLNYYLLLAIIGMSFLYILVEYRLVINMLDQIFIPHRVEFVTSYNDFSNSMKKSTNLFFYGQYHAHSIHSQFLLPFILLSTFILLFNKRVSKYLSLLISISLILSIIYFKDYFGEQWIVFVKKGIYSNEYRNYYVFISVILMLILLIKEQLNSFLIFSAILLISVFSGFEDYIGIKYFKESFSLLTQIQFDRFYFLFAFLWFLLFALLSKALLNKTKYSIVFIIIIIFMQTTYSFKIQNGEAWRKPISMNQFYSQDLFDDIKKYINLPISDYRIMHIGMHPAIGIYNGFYTLDAYWAIYPLEYKHEFRKIIAPQLAKSEKWTKYFDNWGSRCRLMDQSKSIELNFEQFKKMGGRYILSSYEVTINNNHGIQLLKKFSRNNYERVIYLYKIN